MKNNLILLLFLLFTIDSAGQVNKFGVPIIRNYPTQMTGGSEQNWCITKDKWGNMYFGNQESGVVKYDGTRWTTITIRNNPRVYSLEADTSGIVYVGAAFEFGYIQPGKKGKPEYISLASRLDSLSETGAINNIAIQKDNVYFLSPKFIYSYNIPGDSLSRISLKKSNLNSALRLVNINGTLLVSDNVQGVYEFRNSEIVPLPGGDFFKKKICTFILPVSETSVLIGTFNDGIYLYDFGSGITNDSFIDGRLNDKLKEVMVYAGAKIGNGLYAIGTTQDQGILVFNGSGELVQQINNKTSDMEDITIYSMYCDYPHNSELWISTQGYISKAYFNYPVTRFSEKQGIETVINSISGYKGNLYMSSDAGVLESYTDKDNYVQFRGVPGAGVQSFPLAVIKSSSGDYLLAGSISGLLKISGGQVMNAGEMLVNFPRGLDRRMNVRKILQSSSDPSVIYIGLETGGIRVIRDKGNKWEYLNSIRNIPGYINGIVERKGKLWFITEDQNALYNANLNEKDTILTKYGPEKGISEVDVNSISAIDDRIYITTSSGIMRYDDSSDRFIADNDLTAGFSYEKNATGLYRDPDGDVWFSGAGDGIYEMLFRKQGNAFSAYTGVLKMLPQTPLMDILYSEGKIYMLKSKYLYVIDKKKLGYDSVKLNASFVNIIAGQDSIVMEGTFSKNDSRGRRIPVLINPVRSIPEYGYDMNEISFKCTTPYYTEELLTEYSCMLEGYDRDWSKWEGISFGNTLEAQYFSKHYTNLPFGSYTFRVRARTLTGLEGNELTYKFIILKPWYATIWAILLFILIGLGIIYLIIKAYTKKLKNENLVLEGLVAERTAVVVKQKEELESSIHYARRIQMALLPSETILSENIRNYFILLKPRDIVSGDFYWMTKKNDRLYIVAADCTGHGVPGAFMSLLGMSFLDEIIDKDKVLRADEILMELRHHVIESLKQAGHENETKDGMDIALLVMDFKTMMIEFSGAYNPCFRVRKATENDLKNFSDDDKKDGCMSNGKYLLETIYASKMPIGISSRVNEDFVFHEWTLEKGVSYYLFSDGYLDQFGGPDGRKFMKKNFKRLILDIQDYPMTKQKEMLESNLKEWMGQTPQIDDILVMGLKM